MGVQQDVISFLAEFTGIDEAEIRPDILINDELGVDGDDGLELILIH